MKRFLYLISPSKINVNFYKDLEDILSTKKVKYFQIRLKKYSDSKIIRISKKVKALTKKYKVKLIINDSPVLAKKINADGCHLGQSDVSIKDSRNLLKKEKLDDFIETANVFGNLYGTDKKFVYDQLQISDVILELDWQGAESIKRIFPNAFLISLIPPSYKDLEDRLRGRALDADNTISKRLSESKTEVTKCLNFDFLILNDEFKKALDDLKDIIFNKKKYA